MEIKNHKLYNSDGTQVRFHETPNKSGLLKKHMYIVIHWTGNDSFRGAETWLTNKDAKASAQLILGRSGDLVQLCDLNQNAWHVGTSNYNGLESINKYSIGIETVCSGKLIEKNKKLFNNLNKEIQYSDAIKINGIWYQKFTDEQHEKIKQICLALKKQYPTIIEIISHKDAAMPRGRKTDCPDELYGKKLLNDLIK